MRINRFLDKCRYKNKKFLQWNLLKFDLDWAIPSFLRYQCFKWNILQGSFNSVDFWQGDPRWINIIEETSWIWISVVYVITHRYWPYLSYHHYHRFTYHLDWTHWKSLKRCPNRLAKCHRPKVEAFVALAYQKSRINK